MVSLDQYILPRGTLLVLHQKYKTIRWIHVLIHSTLYLGQIVKLNYKISIRVLIHLQFLITVVLNEIHL